MTRTERPTKRWGATPDGGDRWTVALWAPTRDEMTLDLAGDRIAMGREDGWHVARIEAPAGTEYGFVLDGEVVPDPAARRQAGGIDARSVLTDPAAERRPTHWTGRPWETAVLLETHVGTFTRAGTLNAAMRRIPQLADLGITAISLMPLGQFPGDRGWGYDGVLPFALHPAYGTPDEMAAFVATAQSHHLMVLVDVVYNHFGPEGNVLSQLSPSFFDGERQTPWGAAIAMERPEVREFFLQNAEMWIRDYGIDGLRLDAVHQIGDAARHDFLDELRDRITALDLGREVHLVAEDERNLVTYTDTDTVLRAQWNDDYHHAVHCLLTGESQSYYAPFSVDPFGDLVIALRDGQVDQGQARPHTDEMRGAPSGHLSPPHFVNSNQTHDQIGNRAFGERLITLAEPGTVKVVHAMLLMSPFVPMLFMGEEEGSEAPFQFFTDFGGDLAEAVRNGRRSEFPEFADAAAEIPDPNSISTFERSRPYEHPSEDADAWRELTRHVLELRRERIVPLMRSGWLNSTVERLSDRSLRALYEFEDGRLEICFTLERQAPSQSSGMSEIFHHAEEPNAALRVSIGDPA